MSTVREKLESQTAAKSFFQYLIPTLLGMMLMSINIVIDGIFVGNGIGSIALASVNIAVPVFSIIISITLLIGIGGGTLYSMAMGEGDTKKAQGIFTLSFILVTVITLLVSLTGYLYSEPIAFFFGANTETISYVTDYMHILFMFSIIIAWETWLSIFVRNDGAPQLAMIALVVSALLNIGLNYWMIFILELEVKGAATATVIATAIGLLVLMLHFFRKGSSLSFQFASLDKKWIKRIASIGFPSFLSEVGMGVFVIGYNIAMAYYAGTTGLAAFSVINYLHTFMFLAFIGIGSSIQPMISYYYGSKKFGHIQETVRVAEKSGILLGLLFIIIGYVFSDYLVQIFGVASAEIAELATKGMKLFFLGYLFMGINFIYMTYYQSVGNPRPSIMITIFRGFVLLILMLLILPLVFGVNGVWLSLPAAEAITAIVLLWYARPAIMTEGLRAQG